MTKIKLEQAENRELALTKFQKMVRDKKQEKADLKKRVEAEGKLSLQELLAKAKQEKEDALKDPALQEEILLIRRTEEPEWTPVKKSTLKFEEAQQKL